MRLVLVRKSAAPATVSPFLKSWVRKVHGRLVKSGFAKSLNDKSLTVVFLDAKEAKSINQQFRGRNYATDVLSFASMDPSSLGELILCWPVLKKQAKEHGLTQNLELGYMVLHGILHLLGFDHEENEDRATEMFRLQDELFADISIDYVNRSRSPLRKKKNHRA